MFRQIKNEWGKLKFPVIITTILLTAAAVTLSGTLYRAYTCFTDLDAWEIGVEWLDFLFPLFVVVPICWCAYSERKDNFLLYTITRVSRSRYLAAKWIASALSALCVIFLPYFLSALFALYVKPPIPEPAGLNEFRHIFYGLYVNSPLVYALALSLWKGVVGVFVMSLGFVLALYVDNVFVVLTAPFVYGILENFIFAILGRPEYRLITSFVPTSVADEHFLMPLSFVSGLFVLSAFTAFLWIYFSRIKRISVYRI
jgi:hypothetical protein